MSTTSRVIAASFATLAFAGTALAQDTTTDPAAAPAEGEPATAADGSALPTGEMTAENPAPGPAYRWTRDIISRVLTLPKGIGQAGFDVATLINPPGDVIGPFDPANVRILAGYGITDDFEINFGAYSFQTSDAAGGGPDKGSIDFNAGYKLLRGAAGGKLEVIGRVQAGWNLGGGDDGDGGLNPIGLGAHVQYNVTPKIAIISGAPTPQLQIGLANPTKPILLNLPVSVGFQATPTLYLQVDTQLASLVLSDADTGQESAFIFGDTTPLTIGAYLNVIPAIDVYATLGTDVTPDEATYGPDTGAADLLVLGFGARYYFGDLTAGGAAPAAPMAASL